MKFLDFIDMLSGRVLPLKFGKHYVRPLLERRKQVPYDGRSYFESLYRATPEKEFSDGITLRAKYNPVHVRYHYNCVENLIIEYFAAAGVAADMRVLDVGSGAGHWIDFFLEMFRAKRAVGIEISPSAAEELRRKYDGDGRVGIISKDVSDAALDLGERFDVVNAIGVMFHVVDDALWERAVANLARHLTPGGVMVVGGQFGSVTNNVQFHDTDRFEDWESAGRRRGDVALVNKRIRSHRAWRRCAGRAGLEILALKRAKGTREIETPENNVMVLGRKAD